MWFIQYELITYKPDGTPCIRILDTASEQPPSIWILGRKEREARYHYDDGIRRQFDIKITFAVKES